MTTDPPALALPEPRRRVRDRVGAGFTRGRIPAKWTLGILLVIDIGILLVVLSFANLTTEGAAKRGLGHSVAILTEIDAYLDGHLAELRQRADESNAATVAPPDYPIAISLPREDAANAERESLRAEILALSADEVYDHGVIVMAEGGEADVSFFSTQGAVRTGMDFLRPTPHRVLSVLTISFAVAAGVLALGLAAAGRGYGRLLGPGLAVLLGAAPFLILAVAFRFALRVAADGVDDYLAREFLTLGQELSWAPIRNGIIFAVGGGSVFAVGALLASWNDIRMRAARR